MIRKNCRVCHQALYSKPLLQYDNMPKSAQFFPDSETLEHDRGEKLEVCQCSGCGLVQLSNEPVYYYKEVIRAAAISAEMMSFRKKQFSHWIEQYSLKNKKIIEVGCGTGEYLSIINKNKVTAFGIEQRIDSVIQCQQQNLHVVQDFIAEKNKKLKNAPFDAFYMLNFLEHLPDPNATLLGVVNNLVEGAVGLIEVPNFDMILKKNLFSEFISDHLFYFTKETFISTLTRNGLDVIECSEIWHDYSISAVVKKRPKTDLAAFTDYQQRLTNEINACISQFPDNSVAIWGAGHQALAIMALTGIKDKIKYVVDSAPFKHNKFTPATHVPIEPPDNLHKNPVEAVIVIAGSYSDEVVKILRNNYSGSLKVFVVDEHGLDDA